LLVIKDRNLIIDLRPAEPFLISLAVSFLITWLMIRLAPSLGLVDIPNERKVHTRPIPKGGGIGIMLGWLSAALIFGLDSKELWLWAGIGSLIAILGLVDDTRPLPWQLRLGTQFLAASAAVWLLSHSLLYLGGRGGGGEGAWLLCPAAVFWIVGLTNAFNMLDNMDALSGGVGWIAAALFAMTSILITAFGQSSSRHSAWTAELMLMGALTGFLWFNRPPARIFMGDAGSTFLGFFFGTASLLFAGFFGHESISTGVVPGMFPLIEALPRGYDPSGFSLIDVLPGLWPLVFCFLFIPWYDLISVVTIRLYQGRSPFHADKQHLSHRLVALGLSKPQAVATICLLAAVIGSTGLLIFSLILTNGPMLTWIFIGACSVSLAVFELVAHRRIRHSAQQTTNR
jgi:UDP-GlcNAc:undecaprenyl-phosphate GlcNAc-1-phosphate transferase